MLRLRWQCHNLGRDRAPPPQAASGSGLPTLAERPPSTGSRTIISNNNNNGKNIFQHKTCPRLATTCVFSLHNPGPGSQQLVRGKVFCVATIALAFNFSLVRETEVGAEVVR